MEYLIGALGTALFFVVFGVGYLVGRRSHKPKQPSVDEETKRRAEKLRQDFQRMMSYDVDKALGRKG